MSEDTFWFRLEQLIEELDNHPHREEILSLMEEQMQDDRLIPSTIFY